MSEEIKELRVSNEAINDPEELRRRNLIGPDALPYQSHLGHVYETGTFAANMARLQDMLDWDGFPARREES